MSGSHTHPLYLEGASPAHRLPPEVKILAALVGEFAVVATPRDAFWAFALYLAILVPVWQIAGITLRWLAPRMLIELPFVVLAVLLPFAEAGDRVTVLGLSLSEPGLLAAWNILVKGTLQAAYLGKADASATTWPKDARSRLAASHGLAALARKDPDAAEALLPRVAQALQFGDAERHRVLYPIALWTAASYDDGAARRLAAVPDAAYDARLHEWRVREALARSDWRAALAAIERMPAAQRGDSRWTYFAARLREETGDRAGAAALYAAAAREPDFHGFLAADRIDRPYALCPLQHEGGPAEKAAVAADPAMQRAMALYRIERAGWAAQEWRDALSRFDDRQRRLAVEVAQDNGWFDRGVFGLVNAGGERRPEELRLYALRFPLNHAELIRAESARNGLDPAWVAAEIRAESVFNPRARSPANAMGLMQVLPSTGAAVARRLGLPWAGAASLYDPATNIRLGTAYLREMKDKYTLPYVAIAAYNAGPTPTARWQAERPGMDADFWVETISYHETRDYVARVLAFSVIYDWRLDGSAVPVGERMHGRTGAARKPFACPATATAAAAAGAGG